MSQPLLSVNGLMMRFGGLLAVNNVELELRPQEIVSLIGPNGAGKTNVIKPLAFLSWFVSYSFFDNESQSSPFTCIEAVMLYSPLLASSVSDGSLKETKTAFDIVPSTCSFDIS